MNASEFCKDRIEAITSYGLGRKSKWEVLGSGEVDGLGAVRIRDAYGSEGLLIQGMRNGDATALPLGGVLPNYREAETATA